MQFGIEMYAQLEYQNLSTFIWILLPLRICRTEYAIEWMVIVLQLTVVVVVAEIP